MIVVRFLAGRVLRRRWRATVLLALLVAVAAGIALAALAAGRRTATSLDRLLEFSKPPDGLVTFCPPDMEISTELDLVVCFRYAATEELRVVRQLPGVEAAVRARFSGLLASPAAGLRSAESWPAGTTLMSSSELETLEGRRMIVSGRSFETASADEIVVNERFVELTGLGPGSEVDLVFWGKGDLGRVARGGETYAGPEVRARVVGVSRGFSDLAAVDTADATAFEQAQIFGGPALAARVSDAVGYGGLVIDVADGHDFDEIVESIAEAFPGRTFDARPAITDADTAPIKEAIDYEAHSVTAFGVVAAIGAAVVVAQVTGRQARREWDDVPTLSAIGVSNRELRAAAALRAAVVGVSAAVGAVVLAVALSPLGPIGIGRRAETDPGVAVDWLVLGIGALLIPVVVIASAAVVVRAPRVRRLPIAERRQPINTASLPATAVAGLRLGAGDRRSASIVGAYLAAAVGVASVVAGAGLVSSLRSLTSTPEEFGAGWDLSVANLGGEQLVGAEIADLLGSAPEVARAAGIYGTEARIGDQVVWLQSMVGVDGRPGIGSVTTDGREPAGDDEVALGAISMRELGLSIGDSVEISGTAFRESLTATVVGVAVVNDTYENSPGRGGVTTPALIDRLEGQDAAHRQALIDPYVVELAAAADPDRFSDRLERRLAVSVSHPRPHGAIRNLERIDRLPLALAAAIGSLAAASVGHALLLAVRRARPQLAVWSALGLTPGQIRSAVAWYASWMGVAALVVGLPAGAVLGRLGWQAVARQVGVATPPVTPVSPIVLAAVGCLAVANLIALYPAWRASRAPVASSLRAE